MREPDIDGSRGLAWKTSVTPELAKEHPAHLGVWIMSAPGYHPWWSWYMVTLITLRDFPGVPKAARRYPGASHEILVLAFHPDHQPDVDDPTDWMAKTLRPVNASLQFHGTDDAGARRVLDALVLAFCDGAMSPDSDYASAMAEWVSNFVERQRNAN